MPATWPLPSELLPFEIVSGARRAHEVRSRLGWPPTACYRDAAGYDVELVWACRDEAGRCSWLHVSPDPYCNVSSGPDKPEWLFEHRFRDGVLVSTRFALGDA